jgi:two-component system sensor histidine kinase VicK
MTERALLKLRPWPRSLGHQLMLLMSMALWLAISLFGAQTIHEQLALARDGIENAAATLARNIAVTTEEPMLADRLDVVEELGLRSVEFPQVREILVVGARGEVLSRTVREPGQQARAVFDSRAARVPVPAQPLAHLEQDPAHARVLAWHPIQAGNVLGWVRVAHGTELLTEMRQRILASTLVVCVLAGLGSVGMLALILRKPLRAIDRAKDFAIGLERVDGQQIDAIEGSTETAALSRALNLTSTRLLQQRREIEAGIQSLQRQEAALADRNEQLRTIFSLSPDALVSIGVQGRIMFANEAFYRMTGLTPQEVIDRPEQMLDDALRARCADPATYEAMDAWFPASAGAADAQGARAAPAQRTRVTLARPRFTVIERVGLLSHSPSVGKLLYMRDITHESEVDRMKSEFLSTAAHELRTPMTSIHACAELLVTRDFEAARRQHLLGIVHRQSTVLGNIVNELLDLARIEARRDADFLFEHVELAGLIRTIASDFAPPGDRPPPEMQGADMAAVVRVDRQKCAQVLRNLLSNAYKYSESGHVWVRLLPPQAGPAGRRVGFEVQDQGIGMTPEQLARVCERFFRADASGHVLGTGLGMSIVKEIVELMDGEIALASEPGQGTTATVWLPCEPPPAPAIQPAAAEALTV